MSNLVITRPPQFTDPWFAEIEQVWDELEAAINDNDTRITTLETTIATDVVTSLSKQGETQLTQDVTLTGTGEVVLTQVGNNIDIAVVEGNIDHGSIGGLGDDDHTQYLLADGTRALSGDISFGMNKALSFRLETLVGDPAPGNQGRVFYNSTDTLVKVDTGSVIKPVGVSDHGGLTGLLDDDHTQYLLVSGARAVTGNFTVNGQYRNLANASWAAQSQEDDGATAVAYILDTANNLTNTSALLLSLRNNGVEKFAIDKDGNIIVNGIATSSLSSPTSLSALIDTDNDSTTETFKIEHDSDTPGGGAVLMEVNEAGELLLPLITAGIHIGGAGSPSSPLDVDGDADISGDLILSGNALIQSPTNLIFQVDSDNDETALFIWRDGTGAAIITLPEGGPFDIPIQIDLGGDLNLDPSARIKSISDMTFQVDSDDDETASWLWKDGQDNNVMTLDEDGNLTTTGTISGGSSPFKFISNAVVESIPATATITIINNSFDSGDSVTITVDGTPTTFIETTDFTVGATTDDTAANLASVIDGAAIGVSAEAAGSVITLTADVAGESGNSHALSEFDQATDNFTLSGATFSGGSDVESVAFELDTANLFPLDEDKLFVLKHQGTEVFAIRKDGTSPNFATAGAASGGYQEAIIDHWPGSLTEHTSTSYTNLNGTVQETFITPVSGKHRVDVAWSAYDRYEEGDVNVYTRVVIDKGTANEQILGDSDLWRVFLGNADEGDNNYPSFTEFVDLPAGSHTLDLECKVDGAGPSGPSMRQGTNSYARVIMSALGSGINGFNAETIKLQANYTGPSDTAFHLVDNGSGDKLEKDIVAIEGERVLINATLTVDRTTNGIVPARVVIDGAEAHVFAGQAHDGTGDPDNISVSFVSEPLSAGEHTIGVEIRTGNGSQPPTAYADTVFGESSLTVSQFPTAGIGAGTIITEDTLSSDYATTSSFADTGLSVTVDVVEGEDIQLIFGGSATPSDTSATNSIIVGYRVDSGTDVPMTAVGNETAIRVQNLSFSTTIKGLSAGAHTIDLRARHDSTRSWNLLETSDDYSGAKLSVLQSRGSIIPVKEDGVIKTIAPSAFNFKNAFVEEVNGEAQITVPIEIVRPSEGGAGIEAAIEAVSAAGGGIVQLLEGTYAINASMPIASTVSNVEVRGLGEGTILDIGDLSLADVFVFAGGNFGSNQDIDAPSVGDTQVVTSTASDASDYLAGDILIIRIDDGAELYKEVHKVKTNGVPGTGVVELEDQILHDGPTQSFIDVALRAANRNKLSNFHMVASGGTDTVNSFISAVRMNQFEIENVTMDGGGDQARNGIVIGQMVEGSIKDCLIEHTTDKGITVGDAHKYEVSGNTMRYCGIGGVDVGRSVLRVNSGSTDTVVRNNQIYGSSCGGSGAMLDIEATGGIYCRHTTIDGNHIRGNTDQTHIFLNAPRDTVISNNTVEVPSDGTVGRVISGTAIRASIRGNTLTNGVHGVDFQTTAIDINISDNVIKDAGVSGGTGINLTVPDNCVISNNIIRDAVGDGITASGGADLTISGNMVTGCGGDGIEITGAQTDTVISGNNSRGNTGVGIKIADAADDNLIIGNNCRGDGITEGTGSNTFVSNIE